MNYNEIHEEIAKVEYTYRQAMLAVFMPKEEGLREIEYHTSIECVILNDDTNLNDSGYRWADRELWTKNFQSLVGGYPSLLGPGVANALYWYLANKLSGGSAYLLGRYADDMPKAAGTEISLCAALKDNAGDSDWVAGVDFGFGGDMLKITSYNDRLNIVFRECKCKRGCVQVLAYWDYDNRPTRTHAMGAFKAYLNSWGKDHEYNATFIETSAYE